MTIAVDSTSYPYLAIAQNDPLHPDYGTLLWAGAHAEVVLGRVSPHEDPWYHRRALEGWQALPRRLQVRVLAAAALHLTRMGLSPASEAR